MGVRFDGKKKVYDIQVGFEKVLHVSESKADKIQKKDSMPRKENKMELSVFPNTNLIQYKQPFNKNTWNSFTNDDSFQIISSM